MNQKSLLKSRTLIVALCLLSLTAGILGSGWYFKTKSEIQTLEMALYDFHSIPAACYMPVRESQEQINHSEQSDCKDCLDVSFKELLNPVVQTRIDDLVPFPAATHYQFLLSDLPVLSKHLPLPLYSDLLLYTLKATVRSIQTTVLVI